MTIILLNMLVMAVTWKAMEGMFEIVNLIFTWIFIVEFLVKHMGLGMKQYWRDIWNKLDGTIVLISVFSMALSLGSSAGLLRTLRVLRLVRLIKGVPGLRSLATTLYLSLPSLGNVGIMLLLTLYVYAVL